MRCSGEEAGGGKMWGGEKPDLVADRGELVLEPLLSSRCRQLQPFLQELQPSLELRDSVGEFLDCCI